MKMGKKRSGAINAGKGQSYRVYVSRIIFQGFPVRRLPRRSRTPNLGHLLWCEVAKLLLRCWIEVERSSLLLYPLLLLLLVVLVVMRVGIVSKQILRIVRRR